MTESAVQPEIHGRRLRPEKRRAILDAATTVFMRDGFGGASIDEIVAVSGVSKRTLYTHFDSKQALFSALIRERCDELLVPLRQKDIALLPPRATLTALGRTFLSVVLSPDGVELYRIVIAEAPRFPELGRAFFEAGHVPAAALLASYLKEKSADGTFRAIDSVRCAEGFFQLVCGYAHERLLLGLDGTVGTSAVDAYLDAAVSVFLDGVRAR